MLWNQFCLIEVGLFCGGRLFTLAQTVVEHGSATVSFETYQASWSRPGRCDPLWRKVIAGCVPP
jgi:hypothetical protein